MKKDMIFIFCLFLTYVTLGQTNLAIEFQGKVKYKIFHVDSPEVRQTQIENATKSSGANANEYRELMLATEDKRSLLEFELVFNQSQSIFRHLEILIEDNLLEKMQYDIALSTSGGNYTYYKNLLEKKRVKQLNQSGQLINIQEDFDYLDWEITGEERKIGKYNCLKAIAYLETQNKDNEKIVKVFTAWFTPEISVPYGPFGIDGLPGLILEASNNQRFLFRATEIKVGNTEVESVDVELTKGGKNISSEKWIQINNANYERIKRSH